jgi:hypothetical protein
MQGAFDSDHVSKNFHLERKLPSGDTRGLVTEDEPIPFIPNAPSSNHKDFHEEGVRKGLFGQVNLLMRTSGIAPRNPQRKPPTNSSKTLKEQMLRSLLNPLMA